MIGVKPTVIVKNHRAAEQHIGSLSSLQSLHIDDVVQRIITLNKGLAVFWGNCEGWAPIEAAQLLDKSRLDWQVSLSKSLRLWIRDDVNLDEPGNLILAWANLGSLVEGTLKLFLSAFYKNYQDDLEAVRRKNKLRDPDVLALEALRVFYKKRIWDEEWDRWVQRIQSRRNAIHAFRHRELGSHREFQDDVRRYLMLIRYVNFRLPYPDDELYKPREYGRPVIDYFPDKPSIDEESSF